MSTVYSIHQTVNKNDLPSGDTNKGSLTKERFDVLNERWVNINNLREYQVMNIGTRGIIESMVNANVPDMSNDKQSHLDDRKDQKMHYINILRENRGEFV